MNQISLLGTKLGTIRKVQIRRDDGCSHVTIWPHKGRETSYVMRKKGNYDRAVKYAALVCQSSGLEAPEIIDQRKAARKKRKAEMV